MFEGVSLKDNVENLSPQLVQGLLQEGKCTLVDVRGSDRVAVTIAGVLTASQIRSHPARRVPPGSGPTGFDCVQSECSELRHWVDEWMNGHRHRQ